MNYKVVHADTDYLAVGYMGDNLAYKVIFDVAEITDLYGSDGTFTLLAKSKGLDYVYPVVVEADMEENTVTWIPTAEDTSNGKLTCVELVYTIGEQIVYNRKYNAVFGDSLADNKVGDVPEAAWMSQTLREARDAVNAAQTASASVAEAISASERARQYAESIHGAVESASASAETASEKASQASQALADAVSAKNDAVSAKNTAVSAKDDAVSAKTSAESSASSASQSASSASQSATTATTKASEASSSASSASTSAQNASASAQSALNAKTASETASASAVSAKTAAETAASLAQQYAESIEIATIAETKSYLGI